MRSNTFHWMNFTNLFQHNLFSAFSLLSLAALLTRNAMGNVLLEVKNSRSFAFSSSRKQLSCTPKIMIALLNACQISVPFLLVTVLLVTVASPFSSCRFSRVVGHACAISISCIIFFQIYLHPSFGNLLSPSSVNHYIFVPMFENSIFIKNSGCWTCLDYPSFQPSPFHISATLFIPSTFYTWQKKYFISLQLFAF